ncbi:multi-sensor signal transduction histidine kinase [Oceaniovalibus guishaninsula JLT2003]|uniref:histidine kinase n=1 Tax=Oceaniovalibus guishaninsula JLT2003 TaxID=1231392 RepID=K2HD67_9RHOB|nr:multi-sensor signal transduction histidine kinase [Oceaniovalibus guishaninsula JLT2003]
MAEQARERGEVDHRIANGLQLAASMLAMKRREVADSEARAALVEAETRLKAMSRFHMHLARLNDRGPLDLGALLDELGSVMGSAAGTVLSLRSRPVVVRASVAIKLVVLVNELVLNAAKHGREDGGKVNIVVSILPVGARRLMLSVMDDGAGLPEGFDIASCNGMGLKIVQAILEELDGTIGVIPTDRGACFRVDLPLEMIPRIA